MNHQDESAVRTALRATERHESKTDTLLFETIPLVRAEAGHKIVPLGDTRLPFQEDGKTVSAGTRAEPRCVARQGAVFLVSLSRAQFAQAQNVHGWEVANLDGPDPAQRETDAEAEVRERAERLRGKLRVDSEAAA